MELITLYYVETSPGYVKFRAYECTEVNAFTWVYLGASRKRQGKNYRTFEDFALAKKFAMGEARTLLEIALQRASDIAMQNVESVFTCRHETEDDEGSILEITTTEDS